MKFSNPTALVLGIVGLAAVAGATTIGVLWALPNSSNPGTTLTMVFGFFGLLVTLLSSVVLGSRANEKMDKLLNGGTRDQLEAVVRDLVPSIVHRVLDERTAGASPGTTTRKKLKQ